MDEPKIFAGGVIGQKDNETMEEGINAEPPQDVLFIEGQDDLKRIAIQDELFFVPYTDERIIMYQPQSGACFLVNDVTKNLIRKIMRGDRVDLDKLTLAIINYFIFCNVIDVLSHTVSLDASKDQSDRSCTEGTVLFKPTKVTLCPTTDCNLRCTYCFASAGKSKQYMDVSLAKHAIDFVIANAVEAKEKNVDVGFHGGGEPTMAFELMKKAIAYARERCRIYDRDVKFTMGTNLFYNKETLDFVIKNFKSLTVSLDGPKDIHDRQRVTAHGGGSFDTIVHNLKILDSINFPYSINSVITRNNIDRMDEMIEFFVQNFENAKYYHFIFVEKTGRAVESNLDGIEYGEFIEKFLEARKTAKSHGKELGTCFTSPWDVGEWYCGAVTGAFWLSPYGKISTCIEVMQLADPLSDYFLIGHYDQNKSEFIIDEEKLARLRSRCVNNMPSCRECFAKYQCRGLCPARLLHETGNFMDASGFSGCDPVRKLIKQDLIDRIDREECRLSGDDYIDFGDPGKMAADDIDIQLVDD